MGNWLPNCCFRMYNIIYDFEKLKSIIVYLDIFRKDNSRIDFMYSGKLNSETEIYFPENL